MLVGAMAVLEYAGEGLGVGCFFWSRDDSTRSELRGIVEGFHGGTAERLRQARDAGATMGAAMPATKWNDLAPHQGLVLPELGAEATKAMRFVAEYLSVFNPDEFVQLAKALAQHELLDPLVAPEGQGTAVMRSHWHSETGPRLAEAALEAACSPGHASVRITASAVHPSTGTPGGAASQSQAVGSGTRDRADEEAVGHVAACRAAARCVPFHPSVPPSERDDLYKAFITLLNGDSQRSAAGG